MAKKRRQLGKSPDRIKDMSNLDMQDQQIAWELLVEMETRVAVVGKPKDRDCTNFDGEILVQSLDSVYAFFREVRLLMRRLPVGRLPGGVTSPLQTVSICRGVMSTLRPFLEKWQAVFRHFWETEQEKNPKRSPFDIQMDFERIDDLKAEWTGVRMRMREFQEQLETRFPHREDK